MTDTNEEIRQLKHDLELAQTTLRQREQALATLNRRLVSLERGRAGGANDLRGPTADRDALVLQNDLLTDQLANVQRQLELLQSTKLFRYAEPLRRVYALTRRPR